MQALGDSLRRELDGKVGVSIIECAFITTPIFHKGYDAMAANAKAHGFGEHHPEQEYFHLNFFINGLSKRHSPSAQPQTVADAIERVFRSERPPIRVVLGNGGSFVNFMVRYLPYSTVDSLLKKLRPKGGADKARLWTKVERLVQDTKSEQLEGF